MSEDEIARRFERDGFVFPIDVMSRDTALTCRHQLESLESVASDVKLGNNNQLNYPHVIFRFASEIVRNSRILDAVEAILGPDILCWGSTFFIKEPHSESYVSWHQDLRYWGLDSADEVSAWLALSNVNESNGCMRFIPASHHGDLLPHRDSYDKDNALTRGQEADTAIDDRKAVSVPLRPGQMSLHHGKLLHCSGPNRSDERRIGLAINYIAPQVRQVVASEDFAVLVRGEDRHGNFQLVPTPREDLSADALDWHRRILGAQNEAMYD
ncbi:MAG: phytanoyl-CoA dioxygenase family protein, partial [Gammaproteobacteria bacterium]|nr:phytanoyl-CoA dioxygenase family protein [Gammaproteobacteria bacterium]